MSSPSSPTSTRSMSSYLNSQYCAQLFAGYHYCLLIIRINPKPVICFNKANFLSNHSLVDNELIEERGPSATATFSMFYTPRYNQSYEMSSNNSIIHRLISLNYQHNRNSISSELNSATPRNYMCRPHLVPYEPPIETVKKHERDQQAFD